MQENLLRYKTDTKYAIIDVETFSLALQFSINRPWEISCLKVIGEQIIEEIDLFIKWDDCQFKIGQKAAEVTKFNQQELDKKGISPESSFEQFWPTLKWADKIICHNILNFDIYLLKGFAEYMGEDWKFIMDKIIDTKSVAQGIKLNRPFNPKEDNWLEYQYRMSADKTKGIKTNLTTLGKEYKIPFDYESLHRSIQDVRLNLLVWNKLKWNLEL